ncbi:MAG: cyclic lactone autoinducer peptide [Bacillota bacterium]|nr:cyclic lactone autoinducer peptide [Bacillota bacterium]
MKKVLRKFDGWIATFALMVSVVAANQVCTYFLYQPELNDDVKELRKF